MFALSDYDYHLPPKLIAQHPVDHRDRSRLLCLDRKSGDIRHRRFDDLARILKPGDLLVVNDTEVIPARLIGRKATGGRVEALLLHYPRLTSDGKIKTATCRCLLKAAKRPAVGSRIFFEDGVSATVMSFNRGFFSVTFFFSDDFGTMLNRIGQVPLPPYIQRDGGKTDRDDKASYQTVFAREKGAVAAPTAGLHFTDELINRLKTIGVQMVAITLHVGYGTFSPVRVDDIRKHRIHTESYRISAQAAKTINAARDEKRRIIAVGTTSCRTLEYTADHTGRIVPGDGVCDLFIYPGYQFKAIDALITNFHLPQSTLLMLVSALAGRERILFAYREAMENGYRFYSYGDAMFIG